MFPFRTIELAFRRFQTRREPRALAVVFDRTAPELLALARHLAPPGTEAEDLVQATFVTAIEAADSHRPGERVLPWLCGILANHARAARRAGRRVVDAARLPHAVADAGLDAESSELRAELRAAIDRLPEVYRPVLRLVFEHGLQAQEVARALERPAGTVRAQVTRGLELLRRTLPASLAGGVAVAVGSGRGLAAVRRSVLSKVGGTGLAAVSPLFLGGLLMLHYKFTAVAAAALFATLGLFWLLQEPPPPITATNTAAPDAVAVRAPLPTPAPEPERRTVAEAAPQPSPADPAASTTPRATAGGELLVRVRNPLGTAAAGVGVAVYPFARRQDLGRRMDFVATDAAGEVRFVGLANGQWAIDVDRVGTVAAETTHAGTTVEHEFKLTAGLRVVGRVLDRRGVPVPGAEVVLHGSRAATTKVATSDAQGAFVVEHLMPRVQLQARSPGRSASLAHAVQAARDATQPLDLILGDAESTRTVRGHVRDAAGHGVDGAVVAILDGAARDALPVDPSQPQIVAAWLRADADGAFACHEVAAGPQVVFAFAMPHAPAWLEVDTTNGDAIADLRLPRGGAVTGKAERAGVPLAGLMVMAWPLGDARIGYLQNLFGMRYATTAADGTFEIEGLPAGPHNLRLMQGAVVQRETTVTIADAETTEWHVDLGDGRPLRVVVQSEQPLTGHRLTVLVTRSDPRDGDYPAILQLRRDGTADLTTDRDEAVDVVLCSGLGGSNLLQLAAVRRVPVDQHEVTLHLRAADLPLRSLTGRLVDAQQAPIAGASIAATKMDPRGLFVRLETVTGADGTFRLGPLPSGDYTLLEGTLQSPRAIGHAVRTIDRDEAVGDLVLER